MWVEFVVVPAKRWTLCLVCLLLPVPLGCGESETYDADVAEQDAWWAAFDGSWELVSLDRNTIATEGCDDSVTGPGILAALGGTDDDDATGTLFVTLASEPYDLTFDLGGGCVLEGLVEDGSASVNGWCDAPSGPGTEVGYTVYVVDDDETWMEGLFNLYPQGGCWLQYDVVYRPTVEPS